MKKLKLKALELGATEVLSREQLMNTFGGETPSGSENCSVKCSSGSVVMVSDCTNSTIAAVCGPDMSDVLCICGL